MEGPTPTRRGRKKLALLAGVMLITGVMAGAAIALLGRAMAGITRSDETASIFNVSADLDHELADAVFWLPDEPDVPREIPPLAREAITEVWLRAWSQPLILSDGSDPVGASVDGEATDGILIYFDGPGRVAMLEGADDWLGLPPHQISHDLRLTFYSEDGAIAAFTSDRSRFLRALPVGDGVEWYETVESFEAVFVLSEKDWRIHHIVRTGVTGEWIAAEGPEPVEFADEPTRSITWRPAAQSPEEFWSTPNMTAVEADLDQIVDLGFDTVRLELPFEQIGGRDVDSVAMQVAQLFLDAADERDLDVTLALLNGRTEHQPVNWDTDDRHIVAVAQALGDHPALTLWELATAPDSDIGVDRLDESMMHAWLVHISRTLRNVDDDTPLTIAFATARAAAEAPPIADVISFAYPGTPDALDAGVEDVRSVWPDRPILVADMQASTHLSLLPGGMTEGEQARFFADALLAIEAAGLDGFNVSTLSDFQGETVALRAQLRAEEEAAEEEAARAEQERLFPALFDPESTERGPELHSPPIVAEVTWPTGSEAGTGLFRVDGTPKPAADVFAPGADLDAVPTPSIVERVLKPFNFVMLALLGLAVGGWMFLIAWDRNLFPFSLLHRRRVTDAETSAPPPPATPIERTDVVTAPTDDLAAPELEPFPPDAEPASRVERLRAWLGRPAFAPDAASLDESERPPDEAIAADTEGEVISADSAAGTPTNVPSGAVESAATAPPIPDLDPAWVPVDPLPAMDPAMDSTQDRPAPRHREAIPSPPPAATPPDRGESGPPHDQPAISAPIPHPAASSTVDRAVASERRAPSPSLAADVLPQPRRTARPSLGDIAVLEVDLQSIDRAMAYAQRPEIAPGLGRYASFMARAACIVTEECGRTGGRPITIDVEGHAPGRRVRVARADEMRLTALARVLHHGDDRTDVASTEPPAVRVALSGSTEGRMIIAGSADDAPTLTLIHLGKRTVTTTDSLGFQVSSEHTMGLITVAAGSTPVAADAYLARVKSILERRDWVGELD